MKCLFYSKCLSGYKYTLIFHVCAEYFVDVLIYSTSLLFSLLFSHNH